MSLNGNILKVSELKTYFYTQRGVVKAVDGVSFELKQSECLCLVGESGCGKSVTALSILRLIESPPGRIINGSVLYKDKDLVTIDINTLQHIRGKEISMIFQDAQSAMNPVFTIGDQIIEQITLHENLDNNKARLKAIALLNEMGIPDAGRAIDSYPHQLSGGMRQRAMVAMGLSCDPTILIADEPTTAVDVTIKAQILALLNELKTKKHMSMIFITHDLGIVNEIGNRAVIMYGGKDVEVASVPELIHHPAHPYTVGLLSCLPDISIDTDRLASIPGSTPNPIELPDGCTFHPRCTRVMDICRVQVPAKIKLGDGHFVSCHLYR
jgi:peptide/nickel transport system ATP-binding protein